MNTIRTEISVLKYQGDASAVAKIVQHLERAYKAKPNFEEGNDLAVARAMTGRIAEAIALLRELEKAYPGKAIVAANLGTALELSGQDREALRWIAEGVKRDPKEHDGTEWLHVKILEAKLALAKNPGWLKDHTVVGVSFGKGGTPRLEGPLPLDERGKPRSLESVGSAVKYQLVERTYFVKPPDLLVGDLYLSLAEFVTAIGDPNYFEVGLDTPAIYYRDALQYGTPHVDRVQARLKNLAAKKESLRKP